jgi:hypothetical protein
LAALAVVCVSLWRQNSTLHEDVALLRTQIADQGNKLEQANEVAATLLDPEATRIELVAVGNKPQPRGKAIYLRIVAFPCQRRRAHSSGFVQAGCPWQRNGRESSAAGRRRGEELCRDSRTRERLA